MNPMLLINVTALLQMLFGVFLIAFGAVAGLAIWATLFDEDRSGPLLKRLAISAGFLVLGLAGLGGGIYTIHDAVVHFDGDTARTAEAWWSTEHINGIYLVVGVALTAISSFAAYKLWPTGPRSGGDTKASGRAAGNARKKATGRAAKKRARKRAKTLTAKAAEPPRFVRRRRVASGVCVILAACGVSTALAELQLGVVEMRVVGQYESTVRGHYDDIEFLAADGSRLYVSEREAPLLATDSDQLRCYRHRMPVLGTLLGNCHPLPASAG